MSINRRTETSSYKRDDDNKYRIDKKRVDRSRSPITPHSSYGITSETYKKEIVKCSSNSSKKPSDSERFIPDEETKKFYVKSSIDDTGFWTSEDYTFRDMIAKDIRDEIEDDIASKGSDEQSDTDSELDEYADRADMDDPDEEQKMTIVERIMPTRKVDEKKNDIKSDEIIRNKS